KQHRPKTAASATQRPHLSVVWLLKNFAAGFAVQRAALSAAEKRDYAELSSFRQPFQHLFLLRPAR
ncbi:MAG: hypothetical protein ACREYA_01970, partial [Cupriavidus necator]